MSRDLYIRGADELSAPAIYESITLDTFACVECLHRYEIHRCDGTTRHYWKSCETHAPMDLLDGSSYDRTLLADIRGGILHGILKKPAVIVEHRYKHIKPSMLWPSVLVDYKHADGCIHGQNAEFKALSGDTLVEHGYGGRDQEAIEVLQQDKDELLLRARQNIWEVQKHGLPPLKCTPAKDGIRVFFKRCNGQFVDIDGFALPNIIDDRNATSIDVPVPIQYDDRDIESEGSLKSLLDTENEWTDYEVLQPSRATSESPCPSLIEDTDHISLEILTTPSWKEEMLHFSTQLLPHHADEWAIELEKMQASMKKPAISSPLLPDFALDTHAAALKEDKGYIFGSIPLVVTQSPQARKINPSTTSEPVVSLRRLMNREQSVHRGHIDSDTLICTLHQWHLESPQAREAERLWRRELWFSGNLVDDPWLEKRGQTKTTTPYLRPTSTLKSVELSPPFLRSNSTIDYLVRKDTRLTPHEQQAMSDLLSSSLHHGDPVKCG